MADPVEPIRASVLEGVAHGFLGRKGGVSMGVLAGLNVGLGADDDAAAVAENRKRAAEAVLPSARLVTIFQTHSADCVTVAEAWDEAKRPRADALVTDQPGVLLGIVTADCAPILLADIDAGIVGAAHAGWRGAYGGIAESVVAAMEQLGATRSRITTAIGPAIAQPSYEVGPDFRENFTQDDAGFFVAGSNGHWQFDLESYVAAKLETAGIGQIEPLGLDTYSDEKRFYSYRRATHRDELTYGRQFSLIGLA